MPGGSALWEPINHSQLQSQHYQEIDQGIWSSSQQINTAAQSKASVMTIIKLISLTLPHRISKTHIELLTVHCVLLYESITVDTKESLHVMLLAYHSTKVKSLYNKHFAQSLKTTLITHTLCDFLSLRLITCSADD